MEALGSYSWENEYLYYKAADICRTIKEYELWTPIHSSLKKIINLLPLEQTMHYTKLKKYKKKGNQKETPQTVMTKYK